MTEKQKLFANEYLIDLNATRAYKAVYKNCKGDNAAAVCAAKLLRNAKVKKYIEEQLEEIQDKKIAKVQEIMEYLTAVMRGETTSEVLRFFGDGCQEVIKKSPDEKERLKAAELLGKRYSLFTDNVKLDENSVVQIIDDIGVDDNET